MDDLSTAVQSSVCKLHITLMNMGLNIITEYSIDYGFITTPFLDERSKLKSMRDMQTYS